eukprot:2809244-Prymnesium_polylepis.1
MHAHAKEVFDSCPLMESMQSMESMQQSIELCTNFDRAGLVHCSPCTMLLAVVYGASLVCERMSMT